MSKAKLSHGSADAAEHAAQLAAQRRREAAERQRLHDAAVAKAKAAADKEKADAKREADAERTRSEFKAQRTDHASLGAPVERKEVPPPPKPETVLRPFKDKVASVATEPTAETIVAASHKLRETVEAAPPDQRAALLEASQAELLALAEACVPAQQAAQEPQRVEGPLGVAFEVPEDEVPVRVLPDEYVDDLDAIAGLVDPKDAHWVTDPLADAINGGAFENPESGTSGLAPLQDAIDTIRTRGSDALTSALSTSLAETPRSGLIDVLKHGGNVRAGLPADEQQALARTDDVEDAEDRIHDEVADHHPSAASAALADELEGLPEESRADLLARVEDDIGDIVEQTTDADVEQTERIVANFARATAAAGPLNAGAITDPIAQAIADGRLQEDPDEVPVDVPDEVPVFGQADEQYEERNVHNSEREFVRAIVANAGSAGGDLLQQSLVVSLSDKGADGLATAVASSNADAVPDSNWFAQGALLDDRLSSVIDSARQTLTGLQGTALNDAIDSTLHVRDSVNDENLPPGDTVSFSASLYGAVPIPGVPGVSAVGEAGGEVTIERTADGGYTVTSALDLSVGLGGFNVAAVTEDAGTAVEYSFDSAEEAQRGAIALLRQGVDAPAQLLEETRSDDEVFMGQHLSAVEFSGDLQGRLDGHYGIDGFLAGAVSAGAEGNVTVGGGVRVEFEKGQPVAIEATFEESASVLGELPGSTDPIFGLAGVDSSEEGPLEAVARGEAFGAEGHVRFSVKVPISGDDLSLGDIFLNPSSVHRGTPVYSVTAEADVYAGDHGTHYESEFALAVRDGETVADGLRSGDWRAALSGVKLDGHNSATPYDEVQRGGTADFYFVAVTGEKVTRHYEQETTTDLEVMGFDDRLEFQPSTNGQPGDPYVANA